MEVCQVAHDLRIAMTSIYTCDFKSSLLKQFEPTETDRKNTTPSEVKSNTNRGHIVNQHYQPTE